MLKRTLVILFVSLVTLVSIGVASGQEKKTSPTLPDSVSEKISWRSIGPANMGGRITAVAVYEADPSIWWAATASGGLLKTENNGIDFKHQFDDQATVSIGDVQVAQSDPNIVWVGTGESNPRNSVSWGDGVYKSTDGGETWKNMGLKKIFQTGALAIHPTNPDIVWVGALGRLWGPNEDRGLYKTVDGGKTWKKVLYVDDKTGVVDVQLNPKNPDEMLVATYERKRDGFDGNDPEKRFGAGTAIYKSTNGGDTFDKVTQGLPTCKLGRIGLDYFESDPNYVFAVIESEKIGQEPPGFPFLGLSANSRDVEVGSKVQRVTKGQAAEAAGLKEGDLIVAVNDKIIANHDQMLKEVYKSQAGDMVKLQVVREGKTIDMEMQLKGRPENGSSRRRRSYFTGTLGGQSGDKQDAQGKDGFEYGGIYMSEDGGSSWMRINSLNPRPMYYSNIQVDPIDRNNIYLCGTSLYRSKDGGKTFTGDGGSDGIHVDHHALWIDNKNPKHMILGNDGGIHVTYDRMENWDHLNFMAIGQFYHVGIDASENYRVYGGLQDNGSWGGPSRSDSGAIYNTDWFRVGGGDGFVTLVDPEDRNQIYYESQNGNMGRIHLETGARGSIRPRGVRMNWNWKTPFILSPHNSRIHYSAGDYVLRSFDRGNKVKRISPRITNLRTGKAGVAGSAISESPVEPGVLYVGTTDGAVWMTKNGGEKWEPLFFQPSKSAAKSESKKPEGKKPKAADKKESKKADKTKKSDADKPKDKQPETKGKPSSDKADPVTGNWSAKMLTDRIPEDRAKFSIKLKLDGDKVTGTMSGRTTNSEISQGTFDRASGKLKFEIESGRGKRNFEATIKDGRLEGEMLIGGGRLRIKFEAEKDKAPESNQYQEISLLMTVEDPVSGTWKGTLESENLPNGAIEVSVVLKLQEDNSVTGYVDSPMGRIEVVEGVYNTERKRLIVVAENEQVTAEILGNIEGESFVGKLEANDGAIEIDLTMKRVEKPEAESKKKEADQPENKKTEKPEKKKKAPLKKAKAEKEDSPKGDLKKQEKKKSDEKSSSPKKAKQENDTKDDGAQEATAGKDDPVTGTWSGTMSFRGTDRDIKLILIRKDNKNITGSYETQQGSREITSGSFDPESKALLLVAESNQFTLEFDGKLDGGNYVGEVSFGERFQMDFEMSRKSKTAKLTKEEDAAPADEEKVAEGPTGKGSLASMMPGPRWVSSIEASRFKAGRCYITFDGHRSNDDGIYAFVTEDFGKNWKSLTDNLPKTCGSVRVLREDVSNENLLYLGCEFSAWWSIDRGETWTQIKGLPTVAVHEFAVHPTVGEVVAGTHGRSLWIADVSLLRQMSSQSLKADATLYSPKDAIRRARKPSRGNSGTRQFVGTNPSSGTTIAYSLGKSARRISLEIQNVSGETIQEFEELERRTGVHTYSWDSRRVPTGTYRVELKVDGETYQKMMEVKVDPALSAAARAEVLKEDALTEFDEWLEAELRED